MPGDGVDAHPAAHAGAAGGRGSGRDPAGAGLGPARPGRRALLQPHGRDQPAVPDRRARLGHPERPCRRPAVLHGDHAAPVHPDHRVDARPVRARARVPVHGVPRRGSHGDRDRPLRAGRRRFGVVPGRGRLRLRPRWPDRYHRGHLARRHRGARSRR